MICNTIQQNLSEEFFVQVCKLTKLLLLNSSH